MPDRRPSKPTEREWLEGLTPEAQWEDYLERNKEHLDRDDTLYKLSRFGEGGGDEATPADLIAAVRRGVESGTIEGEVVGWCVNHRNIAWEDFQGDDDDMPVSVGYRCSAGSWIEGANAWDCNMRPTLITPVSDGGSET